MSGWFNFKVLRMHTLDDIINLYNNLSNVEAWREAFIRYEQSQNSNALVEEKNLAPLTLKQCEMLYDVLYHEKDSPLYQSWFLGQCIQNDDIESFEMVLKRISNQQLLQIQDYTKTTLLATIARFSQASPKFFSMMQHRLSCLENTKRLNYLNKESDQGTSALDQSLIANNQIMCGYLLDEGCDLDQSQASRESLVGNLDALVQRGQVGLLKLIVEKKHLSGGQVVDLLSIRNFKLMCDNLQRAVVAKQTQLEFMHSNNYEDCLPSDKKVFAAKIEELTSRIQTLSQAPSAFEDVLFDKFEHDPGLTDIGKRIISAHVYCAYRNLKSSQEVSPNQFLSELKKMYAEASGLVNEELKEILLTDFSDTFGPQITADLYRPTSPSSWFFQQAGSWKNEWKSGPNELVCDYINQYQSENAHQCYKKLGLSPPEKKGPQLKR
jgi:hypothetical protein